MSSRKGPAGVSNRKPIPYPYPQFAGLNMREILAKLYVLGVSRLNELPQSKNSTTPERAILSAQNSVPTFGFGNE